MAEDYKPIDMGGYPYKQGDKLPGGITVILVVKGTDKDTSKGLICREVLGVDRRNNPIYGDTVICKDHIDAMDGEKHENTLKIIGIEPDPQNQWVYYNVEGEKRQQRARPDEFLELVKAGKVSTSAEGKTICKAETNAGNPCKRSPVEGEDYCSAHIGE